MTIVLFILLMRFINLLLLLLPILQRPNDVSAVSHTHLPFISSHVCLYGHIEEHSVADEKRESSYYNGTERQ
jgi:hypothetical protein